MSTHSDSINPMSSFLKFAGISIASIIILILINNMLFKDEVKEESAKIADKETVVDPKQIAENIKPIGEVTLTATNTGAPQAPRSGEEIYKTTCSVCHLTGVANAPKIDDKAVWEPRIAAGLASLMTNAINGKGAMPPRGGKADLSDDELKATVLYMTNLVGFELGESTVEKTTATPTALSEIPTTSAPPVVTPEVPSASAPVVTPETPAAPVVTPETPAAPVVTPEVPSASAAPVITPTVSSTPAPVETPEAPSAPAPVITPEAPSAPVPSTPKPEAPVPTPEAAALGYVLIPPTQPTPSVQPIEAPSPTRL